MIVNFSEPVTMRFIILSIAMIFLLVAMGVFGVKKFKKRA